jgi:SAM-dependent methyltransferase
MDTGIAPKNTSHTKAARCGEPSYVWRAGQDRRLGMILQAANKRISRIVLENGCGVGMYAEHLAGYGGTIIGLEYDFERAVEAHHRADEITNAAGERLPFDDQTFDLILSHEVLEHVQDDQMAVREMVRVLQPGGRIALFVPNRGYPFETHGVFWRDHYRFGNIPLVNYLPRKLRDRLAPHVRIYTWRDLQHLFGGLPVRYISRTVIFGAYDNIIAKHEKVGKLLREILLILEKTPLKVFGLSHFWVIEKTK